MAKEGNKNIRQTAPFKEAIKTCLTNGHSPHAIALAIHDIAIADGRYTGECRGKGLNYEKIHDIVLKIQEYMKKLLK